MAHLIIQTGKHRGKKIVLPETEVVLGRDEACQIQLGSNDVSREHCALRSTADGLWVRDLGSRNGTLVNDQAITEETRLMPGDLLQVGPMLFLVPGKKEPDPIKPAAAAGTGKEPATDDDIVSWLAGDEENAAGPGDTTIIPQKPPKPDQPPKEQPPEEPPPSQKQFQSIAEEAADIIRRHWESVHAQRKRP